MNKTIGAVSKGLMAAGVCAVGMTANANPITGSISFFGNVTPIVGSTLGNPTATGYDTAGALVFGATQVAAGATENFMANTFSGESVSVYSPLKLNPAVSPSPAALWSVGVFSFTLSSLVQTLTLSDVLILKGTGTIHDSSGLVGDDNTGTWTATFNGDGTTFSWSSTSPFRTPVVPETSSSLVLLGFGLAGMGILGFRKQLNVV